MLRLPTFNEFVVLLDTKAIRVSIEVDQEMAKATGAGKVLVKVCPAHVYSEEPDGTISVEFAACLECGTCRAVAAPGLLKWHYPEGSMGVMFREG